MNVRLRRLESSAFRIFQRATVSLTILCCALTSGCVRRRLMVRSNPPAAMVYVDNQPIGVTPCAVDFVYYGTREIRLVKAGFETLTVNQPIPTPWYELPPLDFVSENLVPRKIQDYRTVSYNLLPQVIVPTEQLLGRAEQLRQATSQGAILPASATAVPGTPAPFFPSTPAPVAPEVLGPMLAPGSLPQGGTPLQPLPPAP